MFKEMKIEQPEIGQIVVIAKPCNLHKPPIYAEQILNHIDLEIRKWRVSDEVYARDAISRTGDIWGTREDRFWCDAANVVESTRQAIVENTKQAHQRQMKTLEQGECHE